MDENPRITELRKKLEKDPGSRLFAQLAEELRKDGKHTEAIEVARKGLEKHANYPSARLTLARALLDSGKPAEARPELEAIVKASPDNILASRLLGDALEDLGSLDAALKQFEQTLRLSPGDKALSEKIAELKARMAPPPTIEIKPAPKVAAASPEPAPAAAAQAQGRIVEPPAAPVVPSPSTGPAIALDRDLASGTFSPGALNAADLQQHFDKAGADASSETAQTVQSIPPAASPAVVDDMGAIEHYDGSATAIAVGVSTVVDVDRTVAFGELEHFGMAGDAAESRAQAGPPPELETEEQLDRTIAFTEAKPAAEPAAAVSRADTEGAREWTDTGTIAAPEPVFSASSADLHAQLAPAVRESSGEAISEEEGEDAGAQTLPLHSVTLADLYLQQGLKQEASAVLSQVLQESPGNQEALARLSQAAEVEPETVAEPESEFEPALQADAEAEEAQTAPFTPPWLQPGGSMPVSAQAVAHEAPSSQVAFPADGRPRTEREAREKAITDLQAFLDAAERVAIEQRASL